MMPMLSPHNILAWAAQVSLLTLIGAALPAVFRIRHPRWQLTYWYALLCACLVLPVVEPWRSPSVSSAFAQPGQPDPMRLAPDGPTAAGAVHWSRTLPWLVLGGIAARLSWLLAGLWRIRRYRDAATALQCLPESVRRARRLAARSADICLAKNDIGPAVFGLFAPIIILPRSLLALGPDAQCAIVCHELLHVKRNDWLVTVVEELIGACLWFHPAVWWLLSQTKLAREQVVDAEVIRLTAAPDLYIDALLVMSNAHPDRALSPAPSFLNRRHLIQRLRCMILDRPISTLRLVASYASMGTILAAGGCLAFMWFPLVGQPQAHEATLPEPPRQSASAALLPEHNGSVQRVYRAGGAVTTPRLIDRVDPEYPDSAREARVQGTVVVQGIVLPDGAMTVTQVLRSLNATLDRNAIAAMQHWRFEPGRLRGTPVPVEIDAEVNFNLSP